MKERLKERRMLRSTLGELYDNGELDQLPAARVRERTRINRRDGLFFGGVLLALNLGIGLVTYNNSQSFRRAVDSTLHTGSFVPDACPIGWEGAEDIDDPTKAAQAFGTARVMVWEDAEYIKKHLPQTPSDAQVAKGILDTALKFYVTESSSVNYYGLDDPVEVACERPDGTYGLTPAARQALQDLYAHTDIVPDLDNGTARRMV